MFIDSILRLICQTDTEVFQLEAQNDDERVHVVLALVCYVMLNRLSDWQTLCIAVDLNRPAFSN